MARVSVEKPLGERREQKLLEKLFLDFSSLGNWQEAEAFLLEFLTKQELVMFAKRLELYKKISDKEKYRQIIAELNITAQTVSDARKRIARANVYFLRILRKLKTLDRGIE